MLWLMCFQVYFKPSHRCIERKLESSAKTRLPLHSTTHPSPSLQATLYSLERNEHQCKRTGLRLWYNLNSFIYDQRRWSRFEGSNDSVFGDSCQQGGEVSPKQKDRTTTNFKNLVLNIFHLVSYCVQKGEKVVFQNDTSRPSWTLRGGSLLGGVLFSQRKSIWNRGRKFQILKMLCKILFIYLWLFAKELWKGFTK